MLPTPSPADLPAFLTFTPVPVRARRDGWSPILQQRFVLALARGMGVEEAARRLGRSRQTAYALRAREGAGSFAAAWDAAVEFARQARGGGVSRVGTELLGVQSVLVPRYYRGRLVGYVQKPELRGVVAALEHMDRLERRIEKSGDGAALRAVAETLGHMFGES